MGIEGTGTETQNVGNGAEDQGDYSIQDLFRMQGDVGEADAHAKRKKEKRNKSPSGDQLWGAEPTIEAVLERDAQDGEVRLEQNLWKKYLQPGDESKKKRKRKGGEEVGRGNGTGRELLDAAPVDNDSSGLGAQGTLGSGGAGGAGKKKKKKWKLPSGDSQGEPDQLLGAGGETEAQKISRIDDMQQGAQQENGNFVSGETDARKKKKKRNRNSPSGDPPGVSYLGAGGETEAQQLSPVDEMQRSALGTMNGAIEQVGLGMERRAKRANSSSSRLVTLRHRLMGMKTNC